MKSGSEPRDPAESDTADSDDAALLQRIAAGDRRAAEALALRWLPRLYRAALRLLDDPAAAEDVAQEAMLRAWRQADRFDPRRGAAMAWGYRIAVNLAIDRRRAAARAPAALTEALADTAPDAEAALALRQRVTALLAAFAALPARQRAALALAYGHDATGAAAARALRITPRALEGLLHRARRALRERLLADDV